MYLRLIFTSLALFSAFVFFTSNTNVVSAQGAGVGLSPATIEDIANPGEVKQYAFTVSNLSSAEQTFYLYKRDIIGVRGGGVPVFANENSEKTGFELTEWIDLQTTELQLAGGAQQTLSFTMDVPEDASPGSHFGGIFVSVEPPRLRSSGAGVGYEVANIISIRIAGDAVEKANLRSFSTENYIYASPNVTFNANIKNEGNVLVRPVGPLEIYNMYGKQVALLTFNESEAGVFPMTERAFTIDWEGDGPGFGRYEAILSLVYGGEGSKSTISSTVSFWILPMNIIGPALGILAVLLLVTYFGVRMYVRTTMARYEGGGIRKVVNRRQRRAGFSTSMLVMVVMLMVTALFLILLLILFA